MKYLGPLLCIPLSVVALQSCSCSQNSSSGSDENSQTVINDSRCASSLSVCDSLPARSMSSVPTDLRQWGLRGKVRSFEQVCMNAKMEKVDELDIFGLGKLFQYIFAYNPNANLGGNRLWYDVRSARFDAQGFCVGLNDDEFVRDVAGRIKSVKLANGFVSSYVYDSHGRRIREESNVNGVSSVTNYRFVNDTTVESVPASGDVSQTTWSMVYDSHDMLRSETIRFGADDEVAPISLMWDASGRQVLGYVPADGDANPSVEFCYDPSGRMTGARSILGGFNLEMAYGDDSYISRIVVKDLADNVKGTLSFVNTLDANGNWIVLKVLEDDNLIVSFHRSFKYFD